MKQKLLTFVLLSFMTLTASAQANYLDTLRKAEPGQGTVVVEQDPSIDDLVNGKAPEVPATPANTPEENEESSAAAAAATHNPVPSSSANEEVVIDTRKKVMKNSVKVNGYRVQVFSGGNSRADRQKAQQIGSNLKHSFPNEPIYVHFYSPSWKCRMGNYRDISVARRVLAQVKALGYTQACLVKGKISVQY